jgi:hypothetical protein
MTSKVYRSAQGKSIDLGTIMLQNETVRAVGNMKVNARGDKLDNNNRVIETKPRQIQRQNARATNVSDIPVETSSNKVKKSKKDKASLAQTQQSEQDSLDEMVQMTIPEPQMVSAPPVQNIVSPGALPEGGLAAAIARSREVKQELEKTRRQKQQAHGVRKL